VAVIEHGSFERASEALGISGASLQRAARDLEKNLNAPLFNRNAHGVLVSQIGRRFGARIRLALREIEWGFDEVSVAQGGASRQMVIGAMPFGGSMLMASCLDDFLRLHPRADIRIMNDSAAAILKSLSSGDVDFVIGLLPRSDISDLVHEALAQTPYSIVAQRGHPLAGKGRVTLDDLLAFDWIVGNPGSCRRACFDSLFAGRTRAAAPIATCSITMIRHLLSRSDRLTLMTSYELDHQRDDLCAIPFGPILPVPSIGITRRANWLPTRMHTDFLDIVRAHVTNATTERSRSAPEIAVRRKRLAVVGAAAG
jgi:LysR family transcriptional regulator of gallate degradation